MINKKIEIRQRRIIHRADETDLAYAMQLVVMYNDFHTFCRTRSNNCITCPYFAYKTCMKKTTEQIMNDAAEIFREYLED